MMYLCLYVGAVTFLAAVQEPRQEEHQRHHEAQRDEDGGVQRGRLVQLICGENKRTQSALGVATSRARFHRFARDK